MCLLQLSKLKFKFWSSFIFSFSWAPPLCYLSFLFGFP
jgi:hypothetical protein